MRPLLFSLIVLFLLGALFLFLRDELKGGGPDGGPVRVEGADRAGGETQAAGGEAPAREVGSDLSREAVPGAALPEAEPKRPGARDSELIVSILRRVDRRPVGGAQCVVTEGYLGDVLRSGSTDSFGRFQTALDAGGAGRFLIVRKEGFLQQVRLIDPGERGGPEPPRLEVLLDEGVPLRGQVLDGATRQPLVGAEIEAYLEVDFAELAEGVVTDRDGRFLVPGVPASKPLTLTAAFPGYRTGGFSQSFEAARSDLLILLDRGAAVEGTVFAPDGQPVGSARLQAVVLPDESTSPEAEFEQYSTESDERGNFRVEGLAFPARYVLRAASDLHGSGRSEPFELLRDQQVVQRDVQLRRSATELAVMVVDDAGRAVPDVALRLLDRRGLPPRSPDTGELDWNRGFARQAGWHVYAPIAAGEYQVIAEREGQPVRSIRIGVEAGRRNEATILLQNGVPLLGRVRNRAGEPLARIALEFLYAVDEAALDLTGEQIERALEGDDHGLARAAAETDEQGRFRFEGLPRREGALLAGDTDLLGRGRELSPKYALLIEQPVLPGGPALELVLEDAPRVIGRFEPARGLGTVSCLIQSEARASDGKLSVDPEGRFELRFPRAGVPFDLILEHEAGAPFFVPDLILSAGEVRDLGRLKVVPGGSVEGLVSDSQGRPIAEVEVSVAVGDWAWWRETTTDRQGRFRLFGLPAVPGELSFTSEAEMGELLLIDDLGGAHRLKVVLYRPGRLLGRLLSGEGRPRADVSIEALFQGFQGSQGFQDQDLEAAKWSDDVQTDAEGRFTLLLRPGRYLVIPAGRSEGAVLVQVEEDGAGEVLLRD